MKTYLQWTTIQCFSILLSILVASSITSITTFMLVQLPSGVQFVTWNWITWCSLPDCGFVYCIITLNYTEDANTMHSDLAMDDVQCPFHKTIQILLHK